MATKSKKTEGSANGAAKTATKRRLVAQPAAARIAPARKAAPRKKAAGTQIPQEVIAQRAYFIGETRIRTGQPGDSLGDWIEAERQLLVEAGK